MQVQRAATMQLETARPNEPVSSLARKMKYANIGFLPVIDEDGRTVGVVTDRDIVLRTVAEGRDPECCYAREVMTSPARFVYEDSDIGAAAQHMIDHKVRRLVIKSRDGGAKGLLSIDDLAVFTHGDQTIAAVLEQVSKRSVEGWREPLEFCDDVD